VVVPCYNEEEVLDELARRLTAVLAPLEMPYEVVLVDDGSRDNTWPIMQRLRAANRHFKIIKLSRNSGHQFALTCGLDQARGEVVLVIDADLQDPPELLPEMLQRWRDGYDVIYGQRTRRVGETLTKRFLAYSFYRVIHNLTKVYIPSDTGDFRFMDRRAVEALQSLREKHRFIRGMVSWVGFNQIPLPYSRPERFAGETKYPFRKSLLLAVDAITSFSTAPLRLATYIGSTLSVISFVYILVVLVLNMMGRNLPGYTSMMGSILLLGGIQLVVLGIIGEYVGRIFEQGQARPLYLIDRIEGEPLPAPLTSSH